MGLLGRGEGGLNWVGLGWVGLGWAGLGWIGLGWIGLHVGCGFALQRVWWCLVSYGCQPDGYGPFFFDELSTEHECIRTI